MKCMKNYFLMKGFYPAGMAGSYSAGRVVQAPSGENTTYDQSYYIMKMELAKGKRKRDGPVRVLYRPLRSSVRPGQNKKEPPTYVGDSLSSSGALSMARGRYLILYVILFAQCLPYAFVVCPLGQLLVGECLPQTLLGTNVTNWNFQISLCQ